MEKGIFDDKKDSLLVHDQIELDNKVFRSLIENNFNLVFEVVKNYDYFDYDELISIASLELIKAASNYDSTKRSSFAVYALKCMNNEITKFLKKENKKEKCISLEKPICTKNGTKKLKDIIIDDDSYKKIIDDDFYSSIRDAISLIPNPEREIIKMRFGFINDKIYSLNDIADELHLSYSYTAKLLSDGIKFAAIILSKKGIINFNSDEYELVNDKKGNLRAIKKKKISPYSYFNDYHEDEINYALSTLSKSERQLLFSAGNSDILKKDAKLYYINRKLKKRLEAFRFNNELESNTLTSDDYSEIINMLSEENIPKEIQTLEENEKIPALLGLGYINGKHFSCKMISDTLGIEEEKVLEIIKKTEITVKQEKDTIEKYLRSNEKLKQKTLN